MKTPRDIKDLENLVKEMIPESLYLDYKESPALTKTKRHEICKDISSFANSDSGMLIYGIIETDNIPEKLDDGIDISTINREWIDQIVSTHITPTIEGLEIIEIKKSAGRSFFVIDIPKSYRGPHQSPDKKYYKRYNFRSAPMEHYEIEDIRNRKKTLPPLVKLDVEFAGQLIKLIIENIGNEIAHDVKFNFTEDFNWYRGKFPHALKHGIKFFPPGRKIVFNVGTFFTILNDKSDFKPFFDVTISYFHPLIENIVEEMVHIDFNDYLESSVERGPLDNISKSLGVLTNIQKELQNINKLMENLKGISGATGIDLSLRTLKNLRHIFTGSSEFEPIDIRQHDFDVIQEVLGVDFDMAFKIYDYFHHNPTNKQLEEIEGITNETIEKINRLTK